MSWNYRLFYDEKGILSVRECYYDASGNITSISKNPVSLYWDVPGIGDGISPECVPETRMEAVDDINRILEGISREVVRYTDLPWYRG